MYNNNDKFFLFLQDLRQKIIRIFVFVIAASFLCYFFRKNIWNSIQYPYLKIKPESSLIFITPFEALYTNNVIHADILRKNRRYAVLIIFIIAGFITPGPDVVSQILLAVPMVILYEIGIWVSRAA